jgi:hypothetical protein
VIKELQPYKEETMEVSEEFYNKYCVNCGSQRCTAEGEWLEECKHYKEETMEEKKINQMSLANCDLDEVEIVLGDKFELVNRDGKYYAVRKKPKYPKTCGECCDVLKIPNDERYIDIDVPLDYNKLLYAFAELLICRDAYWKIAGEQMGLGKPWEPDTCQIVYSIGRDSNKIANKIGLCNNMFGGYFILEFPTEEMRDAFCENFRDLIELCKELL